MTQQSRKVRRDELYKLVWRTRREQLLEIEIWPSAQDTNINQPIQSWWN